MKNFTLNIELGNDLMSEPEDVANALQIVTAKIRAGFTNGMVRDGNGNTVGSWSLV